MDIFNGTRESKLKIAIASGKGGVGKSMLTSALAMLFAQDYKIAAVDCDADTPNLDIWLGGTGFKGESRISRRTEKWEKTIPVTTSAIPEIDYKKCNSCGLCAKICQFGAMEMVNPAEKISNGVKSKPQVNKFLCEGCGACEVICPQKAIKLKPVQNGQIIIKKISSAQKKLSNGIRYSFPLISGQLLPGESGSGKVVDEIKAEADKFNKELQILDSAPGTGCPVTAALRDTDFVVLICEPTPSGFTDLKRVLEVVEHFNISWGIVINKWDIYKELSHQIEKWAGNKFLGKISYDKRIFQAIAKLTPILFTDLKAVEEIKNIFKKLNKVY